MGAVQEQFLTVREVAELLKLGERTLYRLAQSGGIPAFKVGGSWRFRRQDIDDWVAARILDQSTSGRAKMGGLEEEPESSE